MIFIFAFWCMQYLTLDAPYVLFLESGKGIMHLTISTNILYPNSHVSWVVSTSRVSWLIRSSFFNYKCAFSIWLTDVIMMQSFEALNQRAVAVVVDPIQSVKGKVVIDAFRLINPQTMMLGQEPRQTTSNVGHLNKPSIQVNFEAQWLPLKLSYNQCLILIWSLARLWFMGWTGIITP